jgi:hypothetical protein
VDPYPYITENEKNFRLAVEEAKELGIDLELERTGEKPGSRHAWRAVTSWPNQKLKRQLWHLGDPDYLHEPPQAEYCFGFGETASEAAWSAIKKICDGGE